MLFFINFSFKQVWNSYKMCLGLMPYKQFYYKLLYIKNNNTIDVHNRSPRQAAACSPRTGWYHTFTPTP